jgi:hypothetical protein
MAANTPISSGNGLKMISLICFETKPVLTVAGQGKFLMVIYIAKQAMEFIPDDVVALTCVGFQSRSVQDGDMPAAVTDETCSLQIAGRFRDAFAANAQHACNQFPGHGQFIRGQSVKRV